MVDRTAGQRRRITQDLPAAAAARSRETGAGAHATVSCAFAVILIVLLQAVCLQPAFARRPAVIASSSPLRAAIGDSATPRSSTLQEPQAAAFAAGAVQFSGSLQVDGSHVVTGGQSNAKPLAGQYLLDLSATVDTDKLMGLSGGTLFVEGQSHGGSNILTAQMPAIQDPDNMDAAPTTSIDRVWYNQAFLGQKL